MVRFRKGVFYEHPEWWTHPTLRAKRGASIKAALKVRAANGLRVGRLPKGYDVDAMGFYHLNDEGRAAQVMRGKGQSYRRIADALGWSKSAVHRFCNRQRKQGGE